MHALFHGTPAAGRRPRRRCCPPFASFNRVYTRFLGTLSEGFLRTQFSLAEGRVIYELATAKSSGEGDWRKPSASMPVISAAS